MEVEEPQKLKSFSVALAHIADDWWKSKLMLLQSESHPCKGDQNLPCCARSSTSRARAAFIYGTSFQHQHFAPSEDVIWKEPCSMANRSKYLSSLSCTSTSTSTCFCRAELRTLVLQLSVLALCKLYQPTVAGRPFFYYLTQPLEGDDAKRYIEISEKTVDWSGKVGGCIQPLK